MNWEQKLEAIKAIGTEVFLTMRAPGDWYVHASMELSKDGLLCGPYGNGKTPKAAVEDHWAKYSKKGLVVVTRDGRFTWSRFLWHKLPDDARGPA